MTTPDRLNSTGQINLVSETIENNARGGNSYTRVFRGSLNLIRNQRLIELGGGASMVKAESTADGNYELTASYPWDVLNGSNAEPAPNTHELEVSMESVDWLQSNSLYRNLFMLFGGDAGAIGALAFLKSRYLEWTGGAADISDTVSVAKIEAKFSIYSGASLTFMLNAFRGASYHGLVQSTQFNTVYRRRIQAASYNQVKGSFTGAGMIWTTAEMTAFENTPSNQWFNLPTNYLWKKTGPRVMNIANQKTEVSYEYIGDLQFWSATETAFGAAALRTY